MDNKIATYKLEDLLNIFDPAVQEIENTGGARILYTFNESEQPVRARVGDTFILEVENPEISFFVSAAVDDFVANGFIIPANRLEGVDDRYSLLDTDLKRLIKDVSIALGYNSEDDIASLLE